MVSTRVIPADNQLLLIMLVRSFLVGLSTLGWCHPFGAYYVFYCRYKMTESSRNYLPDLLSSVISYATVCWQLDYVVG